MKKKLFLAVILLVSIYGLAWSSEKETIRFWSDQTDPLQKEAITEMVKEFETKFPNASVKVEYISWKDMHPKLATSAAAKTLPEAATFEDIYNATLPMQGLLLPIDEVVEDIGGPDAFPEGSLSVSKYKGHYYTLPSGIIPTLLWYRKDVFQEHNLKPPRNWEDLMRVSRSLCEDTDKDGRVDRWGLGVPYGRSGMVTRFLLGLIWSNGGKVFDENLRVVFNSRNNIETLQFFKEMAKLSPPGSSEWDYYKTMDSFVTGLVSSVPYFGRVLQHVYQNNPRIFPHIEGMRIPGVTGKQQYAYVAIRGIGVFKDSKYPDLGKEWVKLFMTSDKHLRFLHATPGHTIPPLKKFQKAWLDHPILKEKKSSLEAIIDQTRFGGMLPQEPGNPVNLAARRIEGENVIPDMVQRILIKGEDVKDALMWATKKIEEIAKEEGITK